jgi:hypothetical protein
VLLLENRNLGHILDVLEESIRVVKYFVRDMQDGQELQPDDFGMDIEECSKWKKFGVAEVKINGHVRRLTPVSEA